MKLINEILKEIATDYNSGDIDKEEFNIKLGLLKLKIESIVINYNERPLSFLVRDSKGEHRGNNKLLDQLLYKAKYKAVTGLSMLQDTEDSKRTINAKIRIVLVKKLYFKSLETTIKRSMSAYADRNDFGNVVNRQIFNIDEKGSKENE